MLQYAMHQDSKPYNPRSPNSMVIPPPRALPIISSPYNQPPNNLNSQINWPHGSDIQTESQNHLQNPYVPGKNFPLYYYSQLIYIFSRSNQSYF